MPKLTVHNAEIKTATLEVRSLTMSGKQVTLSVFRQLYERDLIADAGTLNGIPWGRVNYHPDPKRCPDQDHEHVVWQDGADLFRSTVTHRPVFARFFRPASGPAYLAAFIREEIKSGRPLKSMDAVDYQPIPHGLPVQIEIQHEVSRAVREALCARLARERAAANPDEQVVSGREGGQWVHSPARELVAPAEADERSALAALGSQPLTDAERAYFAEVDGELARRKQHAEVRRALADLPHLFIAV
jgi:hypothetical protein